MNFLNYFYDPLKINHTNVWFWSDMHIGHKCESWETPLWKSRGFSSVEEHDETLIKRWNDNLGEESEIFHLGDIMFGSGGEQRLTALLETLTFKILYLLSGNHQSGYKQLLQKSLNEDGVRYISFGDKKVYFVPNYLEMFVCGQPIVISHYAIASWNGQGKGSFMIHGHSHSTLYKSELGKLLYQSKIIDVGVENCPSPVSFSEIRNKFKNNESVTFDHHNPKTNNPF